MEIASLVLILAGAGAGVPPTPSQSAPAAAAAKGAADGCHSQNTRDIVVCAQRRQGYRLDPSVMDAKREVEIRSRTASAPLPAAQASCAASPTGCGKGLEGLDLANVAVVVGTTAVKAAKGDDWRKAFRTSGSDEYQLYLQAKREREAREADRKAELARAAAAAAQSTAAH